MNVERELAALKKMTTGQLKERYAEVFGEQSSSHHRTWLIRRIIWRLQALEYGDLSERARKRAAELANDADIRRSPPRESKVAVKPKAKQPNRLPPAGNVITRVYKGETLEVKVLDTGFSYEGETYKSLSAVAKKISGSHCNGFLFFRLGSPK